MPDPGSLSRPSGSLAANRIGSGAVLSFVVSAAAPLTVVAGGATTGWAVTGVTGIPVAYVAISGLLALFAVGYAAMARQVTNAGALYSHVTCGLGPVAGVAAAFVALLAYNALQIGLYGGFGVVTAGLVGDRLGWSVPWWGCALAAWAAVGLLGVLRIELNGHVLAALILLECLVILVFDAVYLAHPAGGQISTAALAPAALLGPGAGAAMIIAITGYVGFEESANYGEESRDPRRTVARATFGALAVTAVLYSLSSWSMSVAAGPENVVAAARTHGTDLVFSLAAEHVSPLLLDVAHVLFGTSLFAALLAFHNTTSRYLFSVGRDRVLPSVLGGTSRRTGSPVGGSLTQTALAFTVIVLFAALGGDPLVQLFFWGTVFGGLGVLVLMTAASVGIAAFFARTGSRDARWRGVVVPGLAAVGLGTVLTVTVREFSTLLGVAPEDPLAWRLPALYAAVALAGLAWGLVLSRIRPAGYPAGGLGSISSCPPR